MNGGEEILDPSERGYVFYSEPQLSGAFLSDPTPSDTILVNFSCMPTSVSLEETKPTSFK